VLHVQLVVDRAAAKLGITVNQIDSRLNDALSQRLISTIYESESLNQYYVVLTLLPEYAQGAEALNDISLPTLNNNKVPLAAISHWETRSAPLAVNHQGQFVSSVDLIRTLGGGWQSADDQKISLKSE
jgi:multidrug efflux pump